MLESYYKELCEGLPAGAAPPAGYDVLGMSQAQATQMLQEVIDEKAAKAAAIEAEKAAEAAEAAAAAALREKVAAETKAAPPPVVVEEDLGDIFGSKDATDDETDDENEDPVKDTIYDDLDRSDGTHEFECSDCGYIIFPAAGREGKFFGDDFCCPNCGAKMTSCGKLIVNSRGTFANAFLEDGSLYAKS